jgi:hypothetical protein
MKDVEEERIKILAGELSGSLVRIGAGSFIVKLHSTSVFEAELSQKVIVCIDGAEICSRSITMFSEPRFDHRSAGDVNIFSWWKEDHNGRWWIGLCSCLWKLDE